MNKKILSIALIFIFTFGFFSVFAAEEALSTVSVQVRVIKDSEKTKTIQLVKRGEDLYISPSDLEFVTRYDYVEGHSSGEYAWFFLGHKIVTFYYESKKVSLPDQDTSGTYGGAVEYNGSYYFHLSSALSWLDCSVSEKNNVMTFSPEMITYYELTQENIGLPSMLLDDYLKDGESSFKILAGANALNNLFNFGSAVVNAMTAACNGNNPEYFNKETYINAFIEMANPDYIGGEIAETVFKTVSNIKTADTLLQACGIDLADTDFENQVALFMAEYGLDSSVQNQAYNFIDSVRAFRIAAEAGKYMKPAADAITTFRANMNSLKGYQDALNSLVQYGGKKKDVVFASAKAALTEIKIPFLDIAKNYIGFFAEELSEKVIEGTIGGNLSLITAVAKFLFSDEYKSVSEKSKIPVFYDIAATADDMTKNEKAAVKKSDQQNNVNAMLLSVLARRRTLECFLFFKNKLKSTATVNNAIAECDEFIAKLLLVECYGTQLENATEDRPADDTEQSTNQPTDHTGSEGSDEISSNNNGNNNGNSNNNNSNNSNSNNNNGNSNSNNNGNTQTSGRDDTDDSSSTTDSFNPGISKELQNEILYTAGLNNGYAWIYQNKKYTCYDASGKILGTTTLSPSAKTTSSGYTMMGNTVVDTTGKVMFSAASLGVTAFILPAREGNGEWYEYEIPCMEDGYMMAYHKTETYAGVTFKFGVVDMTGKWIVPLSETNPIATTTLSGHGSTITENLIREEIFYAGDGCFVFDINYKTTGIYDVKTATLSTVDYGRGPENFFFLNGKMIWKEVYQQATKYYYLLPDGTETMFLETEGSGSIFEHAKTYKINTRFFWVGETLWDRSTLKALPASENQKYYDEMYVKGYKPLIIENSEGTTYFALENASGYKFEPVKLSSAIYSTDWFETNDGQYYICETGTYPFYKYHIYDSNGKFVTSFEKNSYTTIRYSNGIVKATVNYVDYFFRAEEVTTRLIDNL